MIDSDTLIERLRERLTEPKDDEYQRDYCDGCNGQLTIGDVDSGACTQCGRALEVGDGSVDEELWDGLDQDYLDNDEDISHVQGYDN